MSASASDILTTLKNLVTALNQLAQNQININGAINAPNISAPTVVKLSAGRIAEVSVLTAGSATGTIYDGVMVTSITKPLYVIPNQTGIYVVNLPTSIGLLVIPGTGQVVTVSYS